MNPNWGNIIKEARLKKNLSQQDLSNIIEIEQSVISKYELMKIEPSLKTVAKLAIALDLDLNELILGKKFKS
jgi:ribosome-binding protein aMBF1 (putative translation factor)